MSTQTSPHLSTPTPKLYKSHYQEPYRGLPYELRTQIYTHLLHPSPSSAPLTLVPYIHASSIGINPDLYLSNHYIEEPRFSPDDNKSYNYDRVHPSGRSDPSIDQSGLSDYDKGLASFPFDKVAPARSQARDLQLQILRLDRATHTQAAQVFYAGNVWCFDTRCDRILQFLRHLSPRYRRLIRDLRVSNEATLRHKGNLLHHEALSSFLAREMRLKTVTLAMPKGYHPSSFLSQMREQRHIPEIFEGLAKAVWKGEVGGLRVAYDHLDSEPERLRLEAVGVVRDGFRWFEEVYGDFFVKGLGMRFEGWMRGYLEGRDSVREGRPRGFDESVEGYRRLYPFRLEVKAPQKGFGEVGAVVEMVVDLAASRNGIARLEALVETGKSKKTEEDEAKVLGCSVSLEERLRYAQALLGRFEVVRAKVESGRAEDIKVEEHLW